jgi:membrane-associated phospholipid phosphatase
VTAPTAVRRPARAPRHDARSTRRALGLAALGTGAFGVVVVLYALSTHTVRGQRAENALLRVRRDELRGGPTSATELLAGISVWSLVAAIGVVVLVALARGRPRLALGAGAVIATSILTTEVLKKLVLPRPRLDPDAPSWLLANIFPSGHTTIAMATAVAFVLVVPYRMRGPAALVGGFYAAALAAATLEAGWHRTSDAVGAVLLVLGMALWACAVLVWWRGAGDPPERQRMWAYVPLAAVAALGGIVDLVGIPRTLDAVDTGPLDGAGVREAYGASLALVALAVAVALGVLLLALRDISLDSPQS